MEATILHQITLTFHSNYVVTVSKDFVDSYLKHAFLPYDVGNVTTTTTTTSATQSSTASTTSITSSTPESTTTISIIPTVTSTAGQPAYSCGDLIDASVPGT